MVFMPSKALCVGVRAFLVKSWTGLERFVVVKATIRAPKPSDSYRAASCLGWGLGYKRNACSFPVLGVSFVLCLREGALHILFFSWSSSSSILLLPLISSSLTWHQGVKGRMGCHLCSDAASAFYVHHVLRFLDCGPLVLLPQLSCCGGHGWQPCPSLRSRVVFFLLFTPFPYCSKFSPKFPRAAMLVALLFTGQSVCSLVERGERDLGGVPCPS